MRGSGTAAKHSSRFPPDQARGASGQVTEGFRSIAYGGMTED
jgi:hypothetical protein